MSTLGYSEINFNQNNNIQKKRELKNKTLKRKEKISTPNPKMDALIKKIHDTEDDEDETNFEPLLPPPSSVSVENIKNDFENMDDNEIQEQDNFSQHAMQEAFTQLPSTYAKQYYQQYIPYYNQSSDDQTPNGVNKDDLLDKLNQIIYLLEDQQEEKTGHVTEELILYCFLGIFIIFVIDSFARVGKYVR